MAVGVPLVLGGLLIAEIWPLLRLKLKDCSSAAPCVEVSIKPSDEAENLLPPQATRRPIVSNTRTPSSQENRVDILRLISVLTCLRICPAPRGPGG